MLERKRLDVKVGDFVRPFHNRHVKYEVIAIEGNSLIVSRKSTYAGKPRCTISRVANDENLFSVVKEVCV